MHHDMLGREAILGCKCAFSGGVVERFGDEVGCALTPMNRGLCATCAPFMSRQRGATSPRATAKSDLVGT